MTALSTFATSFNKTFHLHCFFVILILLIGRNYPYYHTYLTYLTYLTQLNYVTYLLKFLHFKLEPLIFVTYLTFQT